MCIKIKLIVCVLLAVFTSVSIAQGTTYRGMYAGGSFTNHKGKGSDERLTGGVLKLGYDLVNFLAIEGHVGGTIVETIYSDPEYLDSGYTDVRSEHAGIYARLNWRLTNITLYGLVGYGYYKTKFDFIAYEDPFFDRSGENDEQGLSYGVGIDLFGSARTAVSINWMQLINEKDEFDNETNVQAIYLGITHYFNPQKTNHAAY